MNKEYGKSVTKRISTKDRWITIIRKLEKMDRYINLFETGNHIVLLKGNTRNVVITIKRYDYEDKLLITTKRV